MSSRFAHSRTHNRKPYQTLAARAAVVVVALMLIGGFAAFQAFGSDAGAKGSDSSQQPSTAHPPTPRPLAQLSTHQPLGSAAITPHLNAADPAKPAFTSEDAEKWAAAHSVFRMMSTGPRTVVQVTFTTSAELSKIFSGASIGLADDALVCYVKLHGQFTASAPAGSPPNILTTVYEVFDARTGNFIMAYGLP